MGKTEDRWLASASRREALVALAGLAAGSPLAAQQDPFRDHSRVPGLKELRTTFDFEPVAYAKLPRDVYDFTALGVEGEFTLRRNREAFDWVEIVPRGIADVSKLDTSTEVLGLRMDSPIMIAPSSGHGQLHPEGEMATHKGATAAKAPMIVSTAASFTIDKIAEAASGPLWFQLYASSSEDATRDLVERAVGAGCRAVVLTVDVQFLSNRERQSHDRHMGFTLMTANSGRRRRANAEQVKPNPYGIQPQAPYLDWEFVDKVRKMTKVPLLLKGILTAEDGKLAAERGADGIVVSNHGGRYLDYAPSTLEVLPEIVDATGGRVPVLIDGGFRRGSDVFKALALGAKAVCFGRAVRWGLAAYGPQGVERVLEILQTELRDSMTQAGRVSLKDIDRTAVRTDFI